MDAGVTQTVVKFEAVGENVGVKRDDLRGYWLCHANTLAQRKRCCNSRFVARTRLTARSITSTVVFNSRDGRGGEIGASEMANIRTWLEQAEKSSGEQITAVVVGKHDARRYDEKDLADENVVLSREDGLAKLDEEYSNGYGGADCYPFWAWTESRVYFMSEYDGSTCMNSVPRHPEAGSPEFT